MAKRVVNVYEGARRKASAAPIECVEFRIPATLP
jgi:hypothetical protein